MTARRAWIRAQADHRTALALAIAGTIAAVSVTLQVTTVVPLVAVLAAQVALTALVMAWHAWTTHSLPRKAARRG